ncbi:flagellin [Occultella aeris]|uniref:Flagellin n=1 Tax=Occultella aeris TaxID=2761496 RepID=A0A7M4DDI0_9MICO|nr:flagellin [Occultella aeris]VZO34899.1 Flagellin [Occultella aeris]
MGFAINTNTAAANAYRNLSITQDQQAKSLEKLSSGLRINRAGDDAAGLSIAEGLRSQVNGYTVAARNAQDGISVVQTAEGALGEAHSILQRMRDLAVQGANDTNNADSRTAIANELTDLTSELTRIADSTNFNGIQLLDATATDLTLQVGADSGTSSQITVGLAANNLSTIVADMTTAGVAVTDATAAQTAIESIDAAIASVSTGRSELGATQNRLEYAVKNINVSIENLTASESRIRDTDMANEMVNFTRSQILSQAGTAMLAQANQASQGVLQLLQ